MVSLPTARGFLRHASGMTAPFAPYRTGWVLFGREKPLTLIGGASKYSRSRIAPIEPVFSCIDPPEPMFMTAASTSAVGSSIGVGFASATVLKAMSNAAGIKGFMACPPCSTQAAMIGPVPRFQNVQFRTHEIVPATRPDGKAGCPKRTLDRDRQCHYWR